MKNGMTVSHGCSQLHGGVTSSQVSGNIGVAPARNRGMTVVACGHQDTIGENCVSPGLTGTSRE